MARQRQKDTGPEALKRRKSAGRMLKAMRNDAGLTQLEVAKVLGFKYYTYVSQWENGTSPLAADRIRPFAELVGVEPKDLAKQLMSYYDPDYYELLFGS